MLLLSGSMVRRSDALVHNLGRLVRFTEKSAHTVQKSHSPIVDRASVDSMESERLYAESAGPAFTQHHSGQTFKLE